VTFPFSFIVSTFVSDELPDWEEEDEEELESDTVTYLLLMYPTVPLQLILYQPDVSSRTVTAVPEFSIRMTEESVEGALRKFT
jgi:hypothetical protein